MSHLLDIDNKNIMATSQSLSESIFFDEINIIKTKITQILSDESEVDRDAENDLKDKILNYIVQNKIDGDINLSEFITEEKLQKYIYKIIGKNYPLLEISRLIPNEKVVDITFLWVKSLNDTIGKEFVDMLVWEIKKILISNFIQCEDCEKPWRLIRDNYKHITFSMDKDLDISKKIFHGEISKEKIIQQAFDNIDSDILSKTLIDAWKWYYNKKEILHLVETYFDFGIWASHIDWDIMWDKLTAFYKAEIPSRETANLEELGENINYDFNKIKIYASQAINIEKEVIETYKDQKFTHEWIQYNVVVQWIINPILIKYVRKWENIITDDNSNQLEKTISKYISLLNLWFDFIAPLIHKKELEDIDMINQEIQKWIIHSRLFTHNYKGTYTQESLNLASQDKEWLRIFIDIVDMWIMNIKDFRMLAKKIDAEKITNENILELLDSGKTATNRFQQVIYNIRSQYPKAKISLGWDEIYIFLEEDEEIKDDKYQIIEDISRHMEKYALKWRISSSSEKSPDIFQQLDWSTILNKRLEKIFEKIMHKDELLRDNLQVNTNVSHIDIENTHIDFINSEAFYNWFIKYVKIDSLRKLLTLWESFSQTFNTEVKNNKWHIINKTFFIKATNENNFINIKIR